MCLTGAVQVLEQVNALVAEMFNQEVLAQSSNLNQEKKDVELGVNDVFDWSSGLEEADDGNLYFSPEMGNVVFCSAVDGWAFSLNTFAKIYSKKNLALVNQFFKEHCGVIFILI